MKNQLTLLDATLFGTLFGFGFFAALVVAGVSAFDLRRVSLLSGNIFAAICGWQWLEFSLTRIASGKGLASKGYLFPAILSSVLYCYGISGVSSHLHPLLNLL